MIRRRSFLAAVGALPFFTIDRLSKGHAEKNCIALPNGIIKSIGNYDFSDRYATLTMVLTVRSGFPMTIGECFFLRAALKKFDELREDGKKPVVFSSSEKKILWTRSTIFSMSFQFKD